MCPTCQNDVSATQAMFLAASVLGFFMFIRKGIVMHKQTRSLFLVLAVLVLVGGVALFKHHGQERPEALETAAAGSSTSIQNAPAPSQSKEPLPRLVELGAGKCKGCIKMAPIIEEVKAEYAGKVIVESIDVIKQAERARSFNWRLIPCQVFINADGKEVWRHEGFLPKEVIVAELKEMGV